MSKFPEIGTDEFAKTIAFELKKLVDKVEEQFGKEAGSKLAITMVATTGETTTSFFAFGSSDLIQIMFSQFIRHLANRTKKLKDEMRQYIAVLLANIGALAMVGLTTKTVFDHSTRKQ